MRAGPQGVDRRPGDADMLVASSELINDELGWEPRTQFEELIELMVDEDVRRLS